MRTKYEILDQHVIDLQKVNAPGDIDRLQAQILIEVLIDIRDTLIQINNCLVNIRS